jgi:hypothetical protein
LMAGHIRSSDSDHALTRKLDSLDMTVVRRHLLYTCL